MVHEEIDLLSFIPFSTVGSLGLHYGSFVYLVPQQQFQGPTIVCLPIKINPRVNCRVGKTQSCTPEIQSIIMASANSKADDKSDRNPKQREQKYDQSNGLGHLLVSLAQICSHVGSSLAAM